MLQLRPGSPVWELRGDGDPEVLVVAITTDSLCDWGGGYYFPLDPNAPAHICFETRTFFEIRGPHPGQVDLWPSRSWQWFRKRSRPRMRKRHGRPTTPPTSPSRYFTSRSSSGAGRPSDWGGGPRCPANDKRVIRWRTSTPEVTCLYENRVREGDRYENI